MNGFEYSDNAKLVLPEFDLDAKKIRIYVEGKDDIPFWYSIFSSIVPENYELFFDEQGGSQNLYKLLDNIKEKQTFIVALDSEYDDIIHDKNKYKNSLTIFTKRHSIENYLFCQHSLQQTINKLNREQANHIRDIENYINRLCQLLEQLIYLDCKKYTVSSDVPSDLAILGGDSNIAKFSNNTAYPTQEKIANFIITNRLDNIDITQIKKLFRNKNLYFYANGHFITYSVGEFVTSKLKNRKGKIAHTSLYDNTYDNCTTCRFKCKDYMELKESATNIVKNYLNTIETN